MEDYTWGGTRVLMQLDTCYGQGEKLSDACQMRLKCLKEIKSMKLVIPLHSLYWSIHTKDESKRKTAFAFIFGVN